MICCDVCRKQIDDRASRQIRIEDNDPCLTFGERDVSGVVCSIDCLREHVQPADPGKPQGGYGQ